MLSLPEPLNQKRFYTQEAVDAYNLAVADYLAQQAEIEYKNSKTSKRKHPSRREQYYEQ